MVSAQMKSVWGDGRMSFLKSLNDRQYIQLESNQMKIVRVPFEPNMRAIADELLPYRLRLQLPDYNRGDRRNTRMLDSTAAFAVDTLENGFLSAASDPATEWFKLTIYRDPDRAAFGPHKKWLDDITGYMLGMMNESNFYLSLATLYGNAAGFGTSTMSVEEGFKASPLVTRTFPTGSYWISQDEDSQVNTFYREIRMNVRQVYDKFGPDADYSTFMKNMVDHGRWEQWIDVGHMIQPNLYWNPGIEFSDSKPWASWWFELGTSSTSGTWGYSDPVIQQNKFLKRSGFDSFPICVARWDITEGDTYALDCPGMKALGDIRSLQSYERRIAQGVEKIINPHWIAPIELEGQADHGFIPGSTTYVSAPNEGALRPAHMIPPNFIEPASQKETEIRQRIGKAFSTDLFQLFDSLPDKERTATEIMQRKSEKLSKLGKPYANFQMGVYRPAIKLVFEIGVAQGMLKRFPPPPDLQGHDLDCEFNGILAQAQKMARFQPMASMLQTVSALAEVTGGAQSDVWDVFNKDKALERMGDALGVPSDVINSDEQIQAIRAQKAQQQAQQQKLMAMESASKSAKNLAQAPTDGKTALSALVGQQGQQ
jgi:Bacteriophage head to tail connecting protein